MKTWSWKQRQKLSYLMVAVWYHAPSQIGIWYDWHWPAGNTTFYTINRFAFTIQSKITSLRYVVWLNDRPTTSSWWWVCFSCLCIHDEAQAWNAEFQHQLKYPIFILYVFTAWTMVGQLLMYFIGWLLEFWEISDTLMIFSLFVRKDKYYISYRFLSSHCRSLPSLC